MTEKIKQIFNPLTGNFDQIVDVADYESHIASTSNPHSVTKSQVGLGDVVNADTTTTLNITDSTNKRFVTDSQQTTLNNTSGVNTGDQDLSGYELLTNKATDLTSPDNTKYPTTLAVSNALDLKLDEDGSLMFHLTKWFVPTSTVSSVGTAITSVGVQFSSLMNGSKLTINGEQRIIVGYISTNRVTVNAPYSVNYTNIDAANWGVYSIAYQQIAGFHRLTDSSGSLVFRTTAGQNAEVSNGLSVGGTGGAGFFASNFVSRNDYRFLWSSDANPFGVKDMGLRRNSAGVFEIYNGVTLDGTLTNRRDILVRNSMSNVSLVGTTTNNGIDAIQSTGSVRATQYKVSDLNTAPLSAADTGTLGEIRVTADYIYVCTATNTWKRTALTTW